MAAVPISSTEKISPTLIRVLVLLGLSVFIDYIDRANLSVAAPLLKSELGLSASQLGILLSAFFWTYSFVQIPVGWLVDRFEVKWVFAIGFLIWSAATAFTGVVPPLWLCWPYGLFWASQSRSPTPRLCENIRQPFRRAASRRRQLSRWSRSDGGTGLRHSVRRDAGSAFWLETVLYCSRSGQSVMAASVASVDAAHSHLWRAAHEAGPGAFGNCQNAISVGILDRPFLLQLLPVSSAYLAAVLPGK